MNQPGRTPGPGVADDDASRDTPGRVDDVDRGCHDKPFTTASSAVEG